PCALPYRICGKNSKAENAYDIMHLELAFLRKRALTAAPCPIPPSEAEASEFVGEGRDEDPGNHVDSIGIQLSDPVRIAVSSRPLDELDLRWNRFSMAHL